MFLRHKNSNALQWTIPKRQSTQTYNIANVRAKRQPSEIRQHQKTYNYTNARSYLIENTKRVIKSKRCEPKQKDTKFQKTSELWSSLLKNKKIVPHNQIDTTLRQSRKAAISNFRRKIWKSSDITPMVKYQQQMLTLIKNDENDSKVTQSQQQIRRYKDTIPVKIQQLQFTKQNIKNQWLQRTYLWYKKSPSKRNPQTSNADLKQQVQNSNKTIMKRQNSKNLTMHHYFGLVQADIRPNTAGNNRHKNRMSDSIIILEPW